MLVLVFDTETTGLPAKGNPSVFTEKEKWPHIIQLSYLLYDVTNKKVITCVDEIIKLDESVVISEESIKIHGITRSKSERKGIIISEALKKFYISLNKCDIVVGHNISFDKRMIMVETNRISNNINLLTCNEWYNKIMYCTMKNSVELCKIEAVGRNGEKYYKYPKLSELHEKIFNVIPKGLHNSMADVLICLRVYLFMENSFDICKIGDRKGKNLFMLYCE